jgi:hypothetical protein
VFEAGSFWCTWLPFVNRLIKINMLSLRSLSSLALLLCLLIYPCASHSHEKIKRTATSVRSSTHSSSVLKPVLTIVSKLQPSATTVTKTTVTKTTTISVYPSTLRSTLHSSPTSTTTVHLTTTVLVTIKPITTTLPSLTAKANVAVYYVRSISFNYNRLTTD